MVPSIGRAATALGDCAWLDAGRARAYARILLAVTLVGAAGWIALSPGGLDREGKPIGTDFVGFYAASRLALDGSPELAYDVGAHWAAQKALFGPELGYTAFFYPPPALLICLPLALDAPISGRSPPGSPRPATRSIASCAAICRRSTRWRSSPFRLCSSTPPTGRTVS